MAQAARKIDPAVPALTDDERAILADVAEDPTIVLTDGAKFDAFLAAVRKEIEIDPGTVATEKGRDRIRSNAAGVSRRKTPIEAAKRRLTEEWRTKTNAVNAAGKHIVDTMDALRDEVRAPLTAWEDREDARKAEAQAIIDDMMAASVVREGDSIEEIRERIDRIRGRNLSDEMFGPRIEMVTDLRDSTVATLTGAIERLEQARRDREELDRLRAESAAREEAERTRLANEQAERERAAAEEKAEADRRRREDEEKARIERGRQEAADRARREAEEAARQEREERERAAQAEIDAAKERERVAHQEAYARSIIQHISECAMGYIGGKQYPYTILLRELDEKIVIDASFGPLEQEAREALAKARTIIVDAMEFQARKDREAEEQAAKEANIAHRSKIQRAAKEGIMGCGVSEEIAKLIVVAILAGNIPHTSIRF